MCQNLYHQKFIANYNLLMLRGKIANVAGMCHRKTIPDWQYIADINQNLKKGDHNSALRSLINSNLDKTVLDIQTFKNMHDRMMELNVSISYHEVVYKLYRETFKPHILMVDIMGYLASTKSPKIMQMLKKDYQILNLQIPQPQKKQREKPSDHHKQPKNQSQSTTSVPSKYTLRNLFPNEDLEYRTTKGDLQPDQVRRILQALLGSYSKVVVHDVELFCNNFEDEQSDGQDQQKLEQETDPFLDDEDLLESMASSISKIRIGKIEIFDNRNPQDPPNDNY